MQTITYDLCAGSGSALPFYEALRGFAVEVRVEIELKAGDIIDAYAAFVASELGEAPRSQGEYGVELLSLGLFYGRYQGAAQRASRSLLAALETLWKVRRGSALLKPAADSIRGRLAGRLLVPHIGAAPLEMNRDLAEMTRLIRWLAAAGEFKDEVARFQNWLAFFSAVGPTETRRAIDAAIAMDAWFKERAEAVFGAYTADVGRFLATVHPRYRGREDEIFTGKTEAEYHLNMVASELMNDGLREAFLETDDRVVLLPGCMRPDEGACRAARVDGHLRCARCAPGCGIARVDRLGERLGFRVVVVPHATSFSRILDRWRGRPGTGVVAVACLLNIAVGGYEMRERDIRSQCVLLDRCGCRKHWHEIGIQTDLCDARLLDVLGLAVDAQRRFFGLTPHG